MRTLFTACLVVIVSAALVGTPAMASPASPASAPLGVVLQADNAQVGADITVGGSTVYDGDNLRTETGGTLRAHSASTVSAPELECVGARSAQWIFS